VRGLVERLSGHSSAGQSSVTFELPGDMLARALFPPITECVYLKIARPAPRPERWADLLDLDVLSDDVAQFLTEAVHARGTILVNGAPRSGRTTLLNVIAGEIAGDEPTAFIDDRRELTLRRRPGLVKLPLEFDDDGRERRLVEAAVRADVARLVLNEVLDREIVDVFTAITSRRLSVLACAPPTESACEPRTLADTLLLLLRLEGLQPETAVALVGAVAPLVVQTDRVAATERWRVARIFSISATGGSELLVRDLWQLDPTTNQLTRVPGEFTLRVHGASPRDVAVLTEAEGAVEAQRQSAASQPVQADPFETSLEGTRLLVEWIQSDVPLPINDPERDCVVCEELTLAVAELERTGVAAETTVHLARWRDALHRGLHTELRLVLGRYTSHPDFPNRLRQAHWDQDDGRPILRDPVRGDTRASEAFYCYQRYRFGAFTAATMRHLDDRPRLRLHDDRGQILELRGVGAGYRGQGARGTVWVLRMAGFPDQVREGYDFSRLERFVFDEENRAFSLRWDSTGWWEALRPSR